MAYPKYRLIEPFYADDVRFDTGTILEFDGCPNEMMEPLNDEAIEKMEAYQAFLAQFGKPKDTGDLMREAMEAAGLAARTETEAKMPKFDGEVPPVGTQRVGATKPRGRPKTVRSAHTETAGERVKTAPPPMASLVGASHSGFGSQIT